MSEVHPSIGSPIRWVLIAELADRFEVEESVSWAERMAEADCDAVLMDMITASHVAPGVRPRQHAVVLRTWRERRGDQPDLVVVTASYDRLSPDTPTGLKMINREGGMVGDAIAVARCSGLQLDSVAVPISVLAAYEANEGIDRASAWTELWRSAMSALRATLPRDAD